MSLSSGKKFSLTLILGGARSGKSTTAERLIMAELPPWIYIATAQAFDEEMRERITVHQGRRGANWQTLDAPLELANVLSSIDPEQPVLVDCLTLWLSNLMLDNRKTSAAVDALLAALKRRSGATVLVSNEVGLGIVPDNALARAFRDEQGRLNQRIAEAADQVLFVAAGLPLTLKG